MPAELIIQTRHCINKDFRYAGFAMCGIQVGARRDDAWADAWHEIDCVQCLQAIALKWEQLLSYAEAAPNETLKISGNFTVKDGILYDGDSKLTTIPIARIPNEVEFEITNMEEY